MSHEDELRVEGYDSTLREVAHDLRQHFHVFEVGLQLLERPAIGNAERTETIRMLKEESQQAKITLDALLKAAGMASPSD